MLQPMAKLAAKLESVARSDEGRAFVDDLPARSKRLVNALRAHRFKHFLVSVVLVVVMTTLCAKADSLILSTVAIVITPVLVALLLRLCQLEIFKTEDEQVAEMRRDYEALVARGQIIELDSKFVGWVADLAYECNRLELSRAQLIQLINENFDELRELLPTTGVGNGLPRLSMSTQAQMWTGFFAVHKPQPAASPS